MGCGSFAGVTGSAVVDRSRGAGPLHVSEIGPLLRWKLGRGLDRAKLERRLSDQSFTPLVTHAKQSNKTGCADFLCWPHKTTFLLNWMAPSMVRCRASNSASCRWRGNSLPRRGSCSRGVKRNSAGFRPESSAACSTQRATHSPISPLTQAYLEQLPADSAGDWSRSDDVDHAPIFVPGGGQ